MTTICLTTPIMAQRGNMPIRQPNSMPSRYPARQPNRQPNFQPNNMPNRNMPPSNRYPGHVQGMRSEVIPRPPIPRPQIMPYYEYNKFKPLHMRKDISLTFGFSGNILYPDFIVKMPIYLRPTPPVVLVNPIWVPPVYENRPVYNIYGEVVGYNRVLIVQGYWK